MKRKLFLHWRHLSNKGCARAAVLALIVLFASVAQTTKAENSPDTMEEEMLVPITVSGKVVSQEDGSGIPGVNVIVKGTTMGTVTDVNGTYTIEVPNDDGVLVFSYVGLETQEVSIAGRNVIDVELAPDNVQLSEVIVVGYGTARKKDLTGSVARVSSEDISALPLYNVEQALNGRAAGVSVQQNSGTPGGRLEVRVRGGNSMIGSNEPLYVVDGIAMTGAVDYLNPNDIESIDILKDASATAIYGSRGANGVVIITTKRGDKNQSGKIEISSYYGVQQEIGRYEVLDAVEFATVANERAKNDGIAPFFDLDTVSNPGYDWQDLVIRTAKIQSHTVTFSGGSKATRYAFSTNYFQQDGIIINTGVKRGSMRFNLDHEVNKLINVGFNVTLARREVNQLEVDNGGLGASVYVDAMAMPPTLNGPYDSQGNLYQIDQMPEYDYVSLSVVNPLYYGGQKNRLLASTALINTYLEINIFKDLKFRSTFGLEYTQSISEQFTPITYPGDLGYGRDGYSFLNSFLNENILTYTKSFGTEHKLNVIGGFTTQTSLSRSLSASASGLANNATENYDLSAASIINAPSQGYSDWRLLSFLGRANYSLKDRYLLTASIRSDGSSRFGDGNKWATFPSAALGWRLSEEPFLKSVSVIDDLKIRASYGITGNTALSPYQSLDRMSSVRIVQGNKTDEVGYTPSALANNDLRWETTTQIDIGFDLSLFKNRIGLSFDYYKKNTNNLLASVPLPPSIGFASSLKNVGEIENKGIEISLNAIILDRAFKWDITGQFSTNQNKIVDLAGDSDIFGSTASHPFNATINIAREGYPMGVFFGLLEDGLDNNGLVKYKDVDGNGTVNSLDRVILGTPYPDFTYGLNSTMSYKNFDLNIFFQGVHGRDLFWETAGVNLNSFQRGMNQFKDLYGNYWTSENPDPNAKYPKVSSATSVQPSDRYVYDASYLRLKMVRLSYNIPVKKIAWLSKAQIYAAGTNLLTMTSYPGLDPEVNTLGSDSNAIGSRLRVGLDDSAYPNAKVYTIGMNLGF
jgi:TonB-linked SusC/RagA family outer membrane protein